MRVHRPLKNPGPAGAVGSARPDLSPAAVDVVETSSIAELTARIQELPEVRMGVVHRVRQEIADGRYETPERLEVTVDRLLEELFPGR